jgi:hypothetical protein
VVDVSQGVGQGILGGFFGIGGAAQQAISQPERDLPVPPVDSRQETVDRGKL